MNIINLFKNFLNIIFKKNATKLLAAPKMTESKIIEKSEDFKNHLKVNLNKKRIVTMQCVNDGLGIQTIKNY